MKGNLIIGDGPVMVKTDKGVFHLHETSFGRHLKEYRNGDEVEIQLSTQDCPYNYTSRCTHGRCDCDTKLYAILKGL
jgi:nitroimidazol reductase NimA-like FMN-containing flavoprotein (pyridoxamine 5'-phosphate oxidase superfamily)